MFPHLQQICNQICMSSSHKDYKYDKAGQMIKSKHSWFCNSQIKEVLSMLDAFGQKERENTVTYVWHSVHRIQLHLFSWWAGFGDGAGDGVLGGAMSSKECLFISLFVSALIFSDWRTDSQFYMDCGELAVASCFILFYTVYFISRRTEPFPPSFFSSLPSKMENIKLITITQKP